MNTPLTRETIEKAKGRELDSLVAVHVFGWEEVEQKHPRAEWMGYGTTLRFGVSLLPVPNYSTDGNWMLLVLEKMGLGWTWKIRNIIQPGFDPTGDNWVAQCSKGVEVCGKAECPTMSEAVCRAALLALLSSDNL